MYIFKFMLIFMLNIYLFILFKLVFIIRIHWYLLQQFVKPAENKVNVMKRK